MQSDTPARFRPAATAWAVCSLVAAVVWLYWPALGFDFINWDDPWYVTNNELIRSWEPGNLVRVATEPVARNYAPLTILSLLVDHTVWGTQPTGYHLTNILLHTANGILVFFLLLQLTGRRFVAWTAALLFLVHPVQVETVVWVSSRKGLLSATFMLASLLFWFRRERSGRDEGFGIAFLAAALLCKAIAVMLPPIVLLYDVLVRRQRIGDSALRQIVPAVMAFLLLSVTMSSQMTVIGGLREHLLLPKIQLLAIDTTLLWRYVGMLVYPSELCVLYDPPTEGIAAGVVMASLGLLVVAVASWRARHSQPLAVLAVAVFYLLFLPVLNLFPLTTLMNDRYLYLPAIAFFGLAGGAAARGFDVAAEALGRFGANLAATTSTLAVAGAFMLATSAYLPVWQNSTTLWTYAREHAPGLMVVRIQQAATLHDQGRTVDAIRVIRNALKECPTDSLDRERMETLQNDWLIELVEEDKKRRVSGFPQLDRRIR